MICRKVFAWITALAIVAFLIFSPAWILENTGVNLYKKWRQRVPDSYTGVIEVWHVVGVKPHTGSVSSWLEVQAARFEKTHTTVFFHITALTEADYHERVAQGYYPDIVSFPAGLEYADRFMPLDTEQLTDTLSLLRGGFVKTGIFDGELYALPYMYSGMALIANGEKLSSCGITFDPDGIDKEWLANAVNTITNKKLKRTEAISGDALMAAMYEQHGSIASIETFKTGNAAFAFGSFRDIGDLERRNATGKGFTFSATTISPYTDKAQFIGISKNTDSGKLEFIYEFLKLLFDDNAQMALYERNAYGVTRLTANSAFVNPLTGIAAEGFAEYFHPIIPNAFLYTRARDALYGNAEDYLKNNTDGKILLSEINEVFINTEDEN